MRLQRLCVLSVLTGVTLVLASVALADYGLTLRQRTLHPGQLVTVWGNACAQSRTSLLGMPIYLGPLDAQASNSTVFVLHPPPLPYRLLGRMRCTPVFHAWGDGGIWNATLRFRVPQVQPGRYQVIIYCNVCSPGRGANLVANNWYFNGERRTELNAVSITRAR